MKYIINTDALYGGDIYKSILLMGTNGRGEVIVQKFNLDELEELNSDYINEHFGDLQDTAYQKGFEDGKAQSERGCEGCKYSGTPQGDSPCYNCSNYYKNNWTAKQTDDEIKVGDEVEQEGDKGVCVRVFRTKIRVMWDDGSTGDWFAEGFTKTGRHFDIEKIFEGMKE